MVILNKVVEVIAIVEKRTFRVVLHDVKLGLGPRGRKRVKFE